MWSARLHGGGVRTAVSHGLRRPTALALLGPALRLFTLDAHRGVLRSDALSGTDTVVHAVFESDAAPQHDVPTYKGLNTSLD